MSSSLRMSDDTNTGPQAAEIYFKLRCVRRLDGDCLPCVTDRVRLESETSDKVSGSKKAQQKLQRNVSGPSSQPAAEYSKSREMKSVPAESVCMSVCVRVCPCVCVSVLQKKREKRKTTGQLSQLAKPRCDTNMAKNHILH